MSDQNPDILMKGPPNSAVPGQPSTFPKTGLIVGSVVAVVFIGILFLALWLFGVFGGLPDELDQDNKKAVKICGDVPTSRSNLAYAQCHDLKGNKMGTMECNTETKTWVCKCGSTSPVILASSCEEKDKDGVVTFTGVPYCNAGINTCGCAGQSSSDVTGADNPTWGWCTRGGGTVTCAVTDTDPAGVQQCSCKTTTLTKNSCTGYANAKWSCDATTGQVDCLCGAGSLRGQTAGDHAPCTCGTSVDIDSDMDIDATKLQTDCGCTCSCASADATAWSCAAKAAT